MNLEKLESERMARKSSLLLVYLCCASTGMPYLSCLMDKSPSGAVVDTLHDCISTYAEEYYLIREQGIKQWMADDVLWKMANRFPIHHECSIEEVQMYGKDTLDSL
jgi:hypothetical protein